MFILLIRCNIQYKYRGDKLDWKNNIENDFCNLSRVIKGFAVYWDGDKKSMLVQKLTKWNDNGRFGLIPTQ